MSNRTINVESFLRIRSLSNIGHIGLHRIINIIIKDLKIVRFSRLLKLIYLIGINLNDTNLDQIA